MPSIVQNGDTGTALVASGTAFALLNASASPINNFTTGNVIVIRIWTSGSTTNTISAVSIGGQAATKLTGADLFESGGYGNIQYWYIANYTGTASHTLTVTCAGYNWQAGVTELPAGGTVTLNNTAQGTANPVTITVTPSESGDFVDVWQTNVDGFSAEPTSPWFDWHTNFTTNLSGPGAGSDIAYQWATSTSGLTATWTEFGTEPWSIIGVVVKYAGAPSEQGLSMSFL